MRGALPWTAPRYSLNSRNSRSAAYSRPSTADDLQQTRHAPTTTCARSAERAQATHPNSYPTKFAGTPARLTSSETAGATPSTAPHRPLRLSRGGGRKRTQRHPGIVPKLNP